MNERSQTKSEEQIIRSNKKIVYYWMNKFYIPESEYDDIHSMATIALMKAARTFDETRGVSFFTYASDCIKTEIDFYFRERAIRKQRFPTESIEKMLENNEDIIVDTNHNIEDTIERKEDIAEAISIILNVLTENEKIVLLYRISEEKQLHIAEKMGLTQSSVSRLEKNARSKLVSYYNAKIQFQEAFAVSIEENRLKISFRIKEVKAFERFLEKYLQEIKNNKRVSIKYDNMQAVFETSVKLRSFYFIAHFLQRLNDCAEKNKILDVPKVQQENLYEYCE